MIGIDVFVFEGILLAVCFSSHIFLWRHFTFKNQAAVLLIIFVLPLTLFAVLFACFSKAGAPFESVLSVALLHTAITCAYLQTYPAIEKLSPSLAILVLCAKHREGLTEVELAKSSRESFLLDEKAQDLLDSGLISRDAEKLILTGKGKIFISPFIFLRRLLGLELGRG